MLLPLIDPLGSNFLKDFPAQNSVNLDLIDDYARASLTSHPLVPYTPVLTASVSNPIVGTGGPAVLRAFYYEIFDQVFLWGEFRFGTTGGSGGNGTWGMSLPFPVANLIGFGTNLASRPVIGSGSIWSNATPANRQPVTVQCRTATEIQFGIRINGATGQREVSHNNPFAWANSDGLNWYAHYQREPGS